ncbi:hypothetical protein [Liquorilactobacillus nagelii]|jgi:hypothetical protein|uniref:hypothetical protein n=1 Tax=Liquorilactobacillus nagelii TaxID=82688 RepID=UPI0006EEE805|nr:hypothetical protein [Liquorilactobacillus nagelii]KRL40718.1 hypothetical protein FD45_GL001362 [Liquorilactobacillus nagelii DSM 13675]QYH53678.1 hypothetical protein G6O73_02770 [Liquorilactobacillus nagelii DSM 13675]
MTLKAGDKLVLKIDDEQAAELNASSNTIIISRQILGKLSKFTKPEKIRFSEAEKKEFDELYKKLFLSYSSSAYQAIRFLVESNNYPELNARVAGSFDKQMDLLNSLRNPSLIEVVKEKKYYIKILGEYYLEQDEYDNFRIVYKPNASQFTQSEIDKLQKLPKFKAIDLEKCKEEIAHDIH